MAIDLVNSTRFHLDQEILKKPCTTNQIDTEHLVSSILDTNNTQFFFSLYEVGIVQS